MKSFILPLFLFLCMASTAFAQDTIIKRDGETINSKVLEITLREVKYKKADNPAGPVYVIPKAEVLLIEYENNTTDSFDIESQEFPESRVTTTNMFVKGQSDASFYYRDYTSAGTGTTIATLLNPTAGLITAIVCSTTYPKEHNLTYPDQRLMNDPSYGMGYRQQAKSMKSKRVWRNFGIGIGINVAYIIILVSQS